MFEDTPYVVTISEFREVDSSILRVSAEDQDLVEQIEYGTQGVAPAPTYFSLDAQTGEIKVAKDLQLDYGTSYIVSHNCC